MNYFVRTESGAEYGPLAARQLRDAARSGTISRRDLVRPEGTVDWFRADKVRGLEFTEVAIAVVQPAMDAWESPEADAPSPVMDARPAAPTRTDDGLMRHIEPLALRGFNVRKLEGEEVLSVEPQRFLDALRVSLPAALIGRRGVLVLTSRRVLVTNATISSRALQVAYLDRIDRIGFGARTVLWRLLLGLSFVAMGLGWWLGPSLLALVAGAEFSPPPLDVPGIVIMAIGVLAILLARFRALEIGVASGTLVFAKRSLELDTLSRIDEVREARLAHLRAGATAVAHSS